MRGPFFIFVSGLQHGGPVGGEHQGVMAIHIDSVNTRQGTPTQKQPGLADDEIRATGGEFDSHELGIGGFIKQFVARRPYGRNTTTGGDLPFAPRLGERHYVNFASSRFIRLVGRPFSVGGQISVEVGRRSLDDRKRFAVSECRERPDVGSRRLIANVVVNDISAIRRPPVGFFITFTPEQQLFAAAPPTDEMRESPAAVRSKCAPGLPTSQSGSFDSAQDDSL
jgi:hypothetical protein